ncbi:K+-sensing histidine kinase KdpD [Bradyrhizobium japonicum]|uniref:DUF4118 domain-containing protein n=1 Tax=Bradyrhizobium sp. C9 TaxID=142585 RepID=UPI000475B9EB|nr:MULTISPECIES: DUF4118 domain-containing protein [Bradyrhizobium]MCP1729165.1 K+-sensing histidine kinase KdpD [Bradyrhizobium elkanii]MCS3573294.1 K+-sensing histidine kinase KdpD [Bradyrhizobium elkanii]MCS3594015.1 K+-sensing histidine kinase KdpD [Bradyrhizobium elkanii]MCS3623461.1 K+-sensing histidine kinase KdpD [Bradyrhizobium elkanii]PDT78772.1 DUF4118 domain-containing protein [Bradyrhizobium sp. C9]
MDRLLLRFMSVTPRYPLWVRYLLSLGLVGLAFVAKLLLDDQLRPDPLMLFIPAIFLASVIFDRGSGVLATGASAALAARYFIPPPPSAAIAPLLIFLASGLCLAGVTEALRTAEALGGKGLRGRSHDGVGAPDQERPRDDHVDPPSAGAIGP